jgi:hypothetical protein
MSLRAAAGRGRAGRWVAAAAALLLAAGLRGDPPARRPVPDFELFPPLPGLAEAAADYGVDLAGVDPPAARARLAPGDTATALITLDDHGDLTQWVLQFTVAPLTPRERALPPRTLRIYSSTGHTIEVGDERAALEVRILGPAREAEPDETVREKKVRVLVNADLLAVGLDRAMEIDRRVAASLHTNDRAVQFSTRPFAPEEVAAASRRAGAAGLTPAEERALIGMVPAQRSFLRIIVRTPGLAEVLLKVLDVSWWTIIRHVGRVAVDIHSGAEEVRPVELGPWNLGRSGPARSEPFFVSLDGRPALTYRLAALPPRPPLLTTAGVIGIAAQRPDGTGPVLMIRLLSARCAPGGKNE